MIIVRSPLRVSLGGGGTDLPSYYREYGGFVISAAIDKYVYITLHKTFGQELLIKYSEFERVKSVDEIKHPLVREAFRKAGLDGRSLEVASMADIPAGTGLGSSGSFTTALLKALYTYKRELVHPLELAEQACQIEIERLREPVGKQDQYISALGGVTCLEILCDGHVEANPLAIDADALHNLEDGLLLFFTGYSRSASSILREQDTKSQQGDQQMIENLHFVKELGLRSHRALQDNDLKTFACLMNEHWQFKKQRSASMSNPDIDRWYELGLVNGAIGGKVIGAGGGGFLMFYAEDKTSLRRAMRGAGLTEVRFRFDFEGTKVVVQ